MPRDGADRRRGPPAIRELLLDLEGLRFAWRVVQPFRGGDNHLLSQLLAQLESYGFHHSRCA
jgi:DUF1009 family protein